MRRHLSILAALALFHAFTPHALADDASEDLAQDTNLNNGDDITRPLARVDVRLGYLSTPDNRDRTTYRLRADQPVNLRPSWKLTFRVDVPVVESNAFSATNPTGDDRVGLGDVLTQVLLTHDIDSRQAFGIGTQVIMPTATDRQLGAGKLQMLPTAGYRFALPEISDGSYITLAARYDVDVAGPDGRRHISTMQLSPNFNLALPRQMFISFYPNTSIRYNFLQHTWFVPADVQVGKLWGKSIITSLEGLVPIYRGTAPLYNYRIEARVGFFF